MESQKSDCCEILSSWSTNSKKMLNCYMSCPFLWPLKMCEKFQFNRFQFTRKANWCCSPLDLTRTCQWDNQTSYDEEVTEIAIVSSATTDSTTEPLLEKSVMIVSRKSRSVLAGRVGASLLCERMLAVDIPHHQLWYHENNQELQGFLKQKQKFQDSSSEKFCFCSSSPVVSCQTMKQNQFIQFFSKLSRMASIILENTTQWNRWILTSSFAQKNQQTLPWHRLFLTPSNSWLLKLCFQIHRTSFSSLLAYHSLFSITRSAKNAQVGR